MHRVYHHPRCSTCKKALKWLKAHEIDVELIDLTESPPAATELAHLHATSGLPVKRFFNTSGRVYRGGGWKDKLPGLTDAQAHEALAADGMLIKRPILHAATGAGERVQVGFKEEQWAAALGVSA